MKELFRLTLTLTIIACVAGVLLAWTHSITAEKISRVKVQTGLTAIERVLPEHDNDPVADSIELDDGTVFYPARLNGEFAGAACKTITTAGYSGEISIMVGISAAGEVRAIEILEHKETPGLGAKIEEPEFKKRFAGRPADSTKWSVSKDGGDIDEITAATISSRAVVSAVGKVARHYLESKQILSSAPGDN